MAQNTVKINEKDQSAREFTEFSIERLTDGISMHRKKRK